MAQESEFSDLCREAKKCWRDGEYQCAVELFEQALELDEQAEVHEQAGMAAYMAGDTENAVTHLKRATHLAPRNAQARLNLGAVYNRRKEYDKAIDSLRKGLGMDMRSAEGYFNLGVAHRRLNQHKLAVPALREAIRHNPEMVDAHCQLATVYAEMGNYKQAIDLAQEALKIRPRYEWAQSILDEAEENHKSAKESAKSLDWIAGVSPTKVAQTFRELSEEERAMDRRKLTVLAHSIHTAADDALLQIRKELGPTARLVSRTLSKPDRPPGALAEAYDAFRQAVKNYRINRDRLGGKIKELRDYEASMLESNGEDGGED